jgi:uncharacterized protein
MSDTCPKGAFNDLGDVYSHTDIEEAYSELYSLYKENMLYSSDDYDKFKDRIAPAPIKAMCINIAHDCNLKCKYCFADEGAFGGKRGLMSADTGKKAIDFVIEKSGSRRNIEIDFFGGEPLINFGVVKEIVEYARSLEEKYNKKFRFTITTNGILLDDDKIE